jgi:hypothetical protein
VSRRSGARWAAVPAKEKKSPLSSRMTTISLSISVSKTERSVSTICSFAYRSGFVTYWAANETPSPKDRHCKAVQSTPFRSGGRAGRDG